MTTTQEILRPGESLALLSHEPEHRSVELLKLVWAAAAGGEWMDRSVGPSRRVLYVTSQSEWANLWSLRHLTVNPGLLDNLGVLDPKESSLPLEALVETLIGACLARRWEVLAFSDLGALQCGALARRVARATGTAVVFGAKASDCWAGTDEVLEILENEAGECRVEPLRKRPIPAWLA